MGVSILAVIHLLLSFLIILLVLIQDPKGGASGGLFGGGGGSNSLFGATGAPSFLAKLTKWVAVIFSISCISMTIFIKAPSKSVTEQFATPGAPSMEAPVNTEAPAETPAPPENENK